MLHCSIASGHAANIEYGSRMQYKGGVHVSTVIFSFMLFSSVRCNSVRVQKNKCLFHFFLVILSLRCLEYLADLEAQRSLTMAHAVGYLLL